MIKDLPGRIKKFSVDVVKFTDFIPKDRKGYVIAGQLIRSGSSVGANYFEAKAASSRRDYTNYFLISLKSCNETIYWLEISEELFNLDKVEIKRLLAESIEISKILGKSVLTLRGIKSNKKQLT